jgi:hypothetical protein
VTSISPADKAAIDRAVRLVRERRTESADIAFWARFVRDECGISPSPVAIFQVLKFALDLPLAPDGHWILSWAEGKIDDQTLRDNVSLPPGND